MVLFALISAARQKSSFCRLGSREKELLAVHETQPTLPDTLSTRMRCVSVRCGYMSERLDTVLVCWHYTYSLCAAGWLGMKEWKRKKCCMVDPKERDEEEKVAQHEDSKMSFLQAAEAKWKSSTSEADKHTHKLGRTRGRNYWKSFCVLRRRLLCCVEQLKRLLANLWDFNPSSFGV